MKKIYLIPFIPIFFPQTAFPRQQTIFRPDGRTIDVATIDSTVNRLMHEAGVTGVCLGIVNGDTVACVRGYGKKDQSRNGRLDTSACFCAASLSKPLFAYLVLQLVDKGVIDLDKPLCRYLPKPLPEYEQYKDLAGDDRWRRITARDCLDHTTGFPNWRRFNPHDNGKLEIFFTPGTRFAYSGEGIDLLQLVVESAAGRPLEDLAREYIFEPFGMVRTGYVWHSSFESDYAVGHDEQGKPLPKIRRAHADAAGSLETTIADYTRFLAAVMKGRGLSQKLKREMLSPQIGIFTKHEFPSLNLDTTGANKKIGLSYGLGWGLFESPFGRVFFKEGHDDGWQHYCLNIPDCRDSFIVMTNSSNGESVFKELVERLTGVEIPWEWEGYVPYQSLRREMK